MTFTSYPTSRSRPSRAGFTLVEMLVALTIGSILILAVQGALRWGLILWHRVEDVRPMEAQARRLASLWRSELAGLYVPAPIQDQPSPFESRTFQGTGEYKLSFYTTTPGEGPGLPTGCCARVTYEYRRADDEPGGGVVVRRERIVAGEKVLADAKAGIVARGLSAFAVECRNVQGQAVTTVDNEGSIPRQMSWRMAWSVPDRLSGQDREVAFASSFVVLAEAYLMQSESEQAE